MTSHYRHRRISDPAMAFPSPIEPGEIAVNTANRQLAAGDANAGSPGAILPLIGTRYFDVRARYSAGEFVVQAGNLYRSKVAISPGAFNPQQWDMVGFDAPLKAYSDDGDAAVTAAYKAADASLAAAIQYASDQGLALVSEKVSKTGDTMTGALVLVGPPTAALEAATKKYVDDVVAAGGESPLAEKITNVPAGNISAVTVQAAINELDTEKAPLSSPAFTNNPTAPTPAVGDSSTRLATTAFVAGQASSIAPGMDGLATIGTSLKYAREDHIHPTDTTRAPIDSPNLTGAPTAPTPPPGDSDTSIATTAFVQNAIGVTASGFSTADAKLTLKTVADAGWVMMNDGTIGDPSSGATARASTDTQALFIHLWTIIPDTLCPVLPGGRGATAAADFAAHKTLALTKVLGRALAIAGTGAGLSARALGQIAGEESHTLVAAEQASMPVGAMTVSSSGPITAKLQTLNNDSGSPFPGNRMMKQEMGGDAISPTYTDLAVTGTASVSGSTGTGTATGGGQAHNNVQPTSFWNVMIKL